MKFFPVATVIKTVGAAEIGNAVPSRPYKFESGYRKDYKNVSIFKLEVLFRLSRSFYSS